VSPSDVSGVNRLPPRSKTSPRGYPRSSGVGLELAGYSGEGSGAFGLAAGDVKHGDALSSGNQFR
jgi:hypothetical protein